MSKTKWLSHALLMSLLVQNTADAQTIYTTATTVTVPASGVNAMSVRAWGGAGGVGGQDCGAGCSNAAGGPVGYVVATYAVTPGASIGIFPGGRGGTGANSSTSTGGGTAGVDTYPSANYNGGTGGNAGNTGSSGGGGGGGAASVLTIAGTVRLVAGGGGGGGGMANVANSGFAGVGTTSANTGTFGGNGTTPTGDGGGGGGGGGGQLASLGGGVHAANTESAGDGGFRGANSLTTPSTVTTNGTIAWTSPGQIEITYFSTVPVTWLSFSVKEHGSFALLNWTTASEENSKDFVVERSAEGIDWTPIGVVPAAGNTNLEKAYEFTDRNPASGINYYRLNQRDIDGRSAYSKIVTYNRAVTALISISPNPVLNGQVTVRLKQAGTINIFNSQGRSMLIKNLPAGDTKLDVSGLGSGIYLIKTMNESIKMMIK